MDASIVVSLRIGSARNLRPTGNREVPRVGHGGRGYGPPGAGRCQWASCGLSLLRCPAPLCPAPASWPARLPSRQGSLWRERPPAGEGRWCDHSGAPPPPARWRTSAEKQGVAPSTCTLLVRREQRASPGGDTRGAASPDCTIADARIPLIPCPMRSFGEALHHTGEGHPLREKRWGC